jgi:2-oxo-hept-3-ene-1,7-dioate hydratase
MIADELARDIAERLREAARTKVTIKQISQLHPELTIEDAYAIQRAGVALAEADGRVVKGRKIGLTSRAMQQAVNITEPDYGVIYADMFYGDASIVPFERFIAPRIEVELAFVLGQPLWGPDCTLYDVLRATDYVTPAIEILDARFQMTDPDTGSSRTIVDTIADNAADAGIITGGRPVRPHEVDLRWVAALLHRNGVVEESGVAAAVLNHPANGVAWLANRLAGHGVQLAAGEVILSGSFTRPVWVRPGDTFHADYGPLGSIAFRFSAEA